MNPPYRRLVLGVTLALGLLGSIPGVAFAAQPACGDTLMANTTLTADLDCSAYAGDGLYMGKKGIVLNLNGYTIWGWTGDDDYDGVDTDNFKHVTIKNGTIANFNTGVNLDNSVGGTVKNLTLTGDPADDDNTGVYVGEGTTNTINNLDIDGFYWGLYMDGSAENWVTNNNITNSTYGVYGTYETGDHFVNNYAEYDYAGFYADYSGGQRYDGNTANGAVDDGYYGFYLNCDNYGRVTVTDNTATGNDYFGFYFYHCFDDENSSTPPTMISGNTANDNDDGEGGGVGFSDDWSIRAVWNGNTAKRNGDDGFSLDSPGYVIFKWNIANRNGDDGIDADDNSGTHQNFKTFANNKANRNDDHGITADNGISGALGNIARYNGNAPDNCFNVDCN